MSTNFYQLKCEICGREVGEARLIRTVVKAGSGWKEECICLECLGKLLPIKAKPLPAIQGRKEDQGIMTIFKRNIEILLTLHNNPPLNVRSLISRVKGSPITVEKMINELMNAGLIEEEREDTFPFRRKLRLTDTGKKVVEKIMELKEILEGG